jgi:Ceramidase
MGRWRELKVAGAVAAVGLLGFALAAFAGWPGATVDCAQSPCFCELAVAGPVRQLSNTASNLAVVGLGVAVGGWAARQRRLRHERAAPNAALDALGALLGPVLVFQGVGSMLFHGGLTVWGGALDAMSMFSTVGLLLATNLLRLGRLRAGQLAAAWAALMGLGLLVGLLEGTLVTVLMFIAFLSLLSTEVRLSARGLSPSEGLFRLALAVHLVGVTVWSLSSAEGLPLCAPNSLWQGHALWHLTEGLAVTLFALHVARNLERGACAPTEGAPLPQVRPAQG